MAETDPRPDRVWAEWEKHGVALLPLGRRFDAIRVKADCVHEAVGSDEPHTVASALETWLAGPVIRDLRSGIGPYYALAAPGADRDGPAERLTTGTYLGVPRPGHATTLSRWVVLPQHPGALCDSRYLRALLATATPLRTVGP
ncbi:hypothetical protein FH965_27100 [Streptomyces spectabilis]|uniref:DNA primase/polymerase bifunctional N-terminal domain-containing protein n=1 Tax=Streptomyces spectabilis TaxID=68270 RepID=A0A516RLR5_STRST|nr:hypothetical protein FH965_27100 [Streptomyces spectabilis]